jgi:hypothetical protein
LVGVLSALFLDIVPCCISSVNFRLVGFLVCELGYLVW